MQDKTQVVPLSKTDFVHTRLTHSLEVSVVARSLGRIVGKHILTKYPDLVTKGYQANDFGAIVAAAALSHDIGNPPFGHSGEKAIGEYFISGRGHNLKKDLDDKEWQDLIDFEGNASERFLRRFGITKIDFPEVYGTFESGATHIRFTFWSFDGLLHQFVE